MRLLHSHGRKMTDFMSDDEIPPYAILSHRWGPEEVSLQDFQNLAASEIKQRIGWAKIASCREQAAKDGYNWVWVDTCCIDKSSSAELSEAINSMFRWYRKAAVCYAYLSDISTTEQDENLSENNPRTDISGSLWFTRGWTLQELIAPKELVFYSKHWTRLGTKAEYAKSLSSTTGIQERFLCGAGLQLASVAQRMSWAAHRNTSRPEDVAYCLLGIFDINLPMIYGEGKKAFRRLQEAIMRSNPEDHTLYAWGHIVERPSLLHYDRYRLLAKEPLPWDGALANSRELLGMFAESPRDFAGSGSIVRSPLAAGFYRNIKFGGAALPALLSNGVVRLDLAAKEYQEPSIFHWGRPRVAHVRFVWRAILLAMDESRDESRHITIPLQQGGDNQWSRTRELSYGDPVSFDQLRELRQMICIGPRPPMQLTENDIMFRRIVYGQPFSSTQYFYPVDSFNICYYPFEGVLRASSQKCGDMIAYVFTLAGVTPERGLAIAFSRVDGGADSRPLMKVVVLPVVFDREEVCEGDVVWHPAGRLFAASTPHHHLMAAPSDTWSCKLDPLPPVFVAVERVPLDEDEGTSIDVVDIIINLHEHASSQEGPHYQDWRL